MTAGKNWEELGTSQERVLSTRDLMERGSVSTKGCHVTCNCS